MLNAGLDAAIADLDGLSFDANGKKVRVTIESCRVETPSITRAAGFTFSTALWPSECRQRRVTYKGDFNINLSIQ